VLPARLAGKGAGLQAADLRLGALVDVYTYIHPYIDISMHGWPSGKRAWPKMKEVFSKLIHWIWSWKLKEILRGKEINLRETLEADFKGKIGDEFQKESRCILRCV
jgi:hypothetical protein